MDAGEGKAVGKHAAGEVDHLPFRHPHRVEAGMMVHGQGHLPAAGKMLAVEPLHLDVVVDIAVDHQQRLVAQQRQGMAQAASGAEDGGFLLHGHPGQSIERLDDLLAQVVAVDDDMVEAKPGQAPDGGQQQRRVEHREKRLGTYQGVGQEARAEPGGENHRLHRTVLRLLPAGRCPDPCARRYA